MSRKHTLTSWLLGKAKRQNSSNRRDKKALGCETLEDRQLMCASGVAYNGVDDSLRISDGNNANETVVITSDSVARGVDRVHVKCSVNGQTKYTKTFAEVSYGNINKIHWNAGNGNNMFVNNTHVRSVVAGGSGDDIFFGGSSIDTFSGSGGTDKLSGNGGNDNLYGGAGPDFLWGNAGNDNLNGGDDADDIRGGSGVDYLRGNDGNDFLWGDSGSDRLWGGAGHDVLRGGTGHDKLYGESGADVLLGGDGNDDLHGGKDSYVDKLWGQAGQDDFFIEQEYALVSWNNFPVFKWKYIDKAYDVKASDSDRVFYSPHATDDVLDVIDDSISAM